MINNTCLTNEELECLELRAMQPTVLYHSEMKLVIAVIKYTDN